MKTLGELLVERRRLRNISLAEAAQATHIREKYLQYLEDGAYEKFPVPLQMKGFIRIYAGYLGIDPEDALAFYRREFHKEEVSPQIGFYYPKLKRVSFKITSQFFAVIGVMIILGAAVSYVLWQYLRFAGAPQLEVFSPRDGLIVNESPVKVEGKVSEDTRITLNNTTIRISDEGYFSQDVPLTSGVNVLTFVAVNTSGKSTTVKRVVRLDAP